MRRAIALVALALGSGLLAGYAHQGRPAEADPPAPQEDRPADSFIDPLGPNSACYVCHMTFVREEMSKVHLVEQVACIECHGLSAAHANDENVGATPPDIAFKRHQVDASCSECHQTHDAPATEVIARFVQRKLPSDAAPVCTDCHGTHKIERAAEGTVAHAEGDPAAAGAEGR